MNGQYIYNVFKTIAIFVACIFGAFSFMNDCDLCKPELFKDVFKYELNNNPNCTIYNNVTQQICNGIYECGDKVKINDSFNAYIIVSFLEFLILDLTLVIWGCTKFEFKYIVAAFKVITMIFCFPQLPLLIARELSCSMGLEIFIYSLIAISIEWIDNLYRIYQWKFNDKEFFNIGTSL